MTNPYLAQRIPPDGVPDVPLHQRQHDSDETDLQRAAAAVHKHTQQLATAQEVGAVIMAVAGIVSAITGALQGTTAIAGFLWFVISGFGLNYFARKTTEEAAYIQEVFDCRLFYLDWNDTLGSADDLSRDRVLALAKQVKADSDDEARIRDGWYDDATGLEHPFDVLCAQEQNLRWDMRLRKRFKNTLLTLGIGWTALGVVVGLTTGTTVYQTFLVVFVPAAAAYALGRERFRVQQQVWRERDRLARIVGQVLANTPPGHTPTPDERADLRLLARRVQDGIFRTRAEFGRVPNLLYTRNRDRDEDDFNNVAQVHRTHLIGDFGARSE